MKIAFRVDASPSIGWGHLSRCRALARAIREVDESSSICFVAASMPSPVRTLLEAEGVEVALLDELVASPSDSTEEQDALAFSGVVGSKWRAAHWTVVDHYSLGSAWEDRVRPASGRVLAIDDLADRGHRCDALLNQNLDDRPVTLYDSLVSGTCDLLLGPSYALLQPEYRAWRARVSERRTPPRRLCVFLGGGQTQRVLSEVLRAVSVVSRNPPTVEVVSTAPLGATLRDAGLETLPRWISWLGTVDSLAPVYARADLAIGACGSACWERLCLRLPSVLIQTAANQRFVAEAMARRAPALYLGEAGSLSRQAWEQALASRLDEFADRIGLEAFPEIDGEGARRVARYMLRAAP